MTPALAQQRGLGANRDPFVYLVTAGRQFSTAAMTAGSCSNRLMISVRD